MTELEQFQAEIGGTTQAFEMVIALLLAKAHENEDNAIEYLETVLQDFKNLISNSLSNAEALTAEQADSQVSEYIKLYNEAATTSLDEVFENAMYMIANKRGQLN